MIKAIFKFFLRLIIAVVLVSSFFVITQDLQIFPGLFNSYLWGYKSLPYDDVDALTTTAADGQLVNIWHMKAPNNPNNYTAVLFHGNAESLSTNIFVQRWLRSIGISSYSVEYRGYMGRWSGWPSENGLYLDSEAAYKLLLENEKISPDKIISFGASIGTGTAAYLASKYNVGVLVLVSPYVSLKELVSKMPAFGYLSSFLKYTFPTDEYISNLKDTCVISAHGRRDYTIPFYNSELLRERYKGHKTFTLLESPELGHNNLLPNFTKLETLYISALRIPNFT